MDTQTEGGAHTQRKKTEREGKRGPKPPLHRDTPTETDTQPESSKVCVSMRDTVLLLAITGEKTRGRGQQHGTTELSFREIFDG